MKQKNTIDAIIEAILVQCGKIETALDDANMSTSEHKKISKAVGKIVTIVNPSFRNVSVDRNKKCL